MRQIPILSALCTLLLLCAACGSSSTSPAAPTIVNFQGAWTGTWVRQSCSETGGAVGVGCNNTPSSGALQLTVQQSASAAQGTLQVGGLQAAVNGSVSETGTLSLAGTGHQANVTINVSGWASTISGTSMNGTFTFVLIPDDPSGGSVTVRAALQGATRG